MTRNPKRSLRPPCHTCGSPLLVATFSRRPTSTMLPHLFFGESESLFLKLRQTPESSDHCTLLLPSPGVSNHFGRTNVFDLHPLSYTPSWVYLNGCEIFCQMLVCRSTTDACVVIWSSGIYCELLLHELKGIMPLGREAGPHHTDIATDEKQCFGPFVRNVKTCLKFFYGSTIR